MALPTATSISSPTAAESVPGGSYLPKDAPYLLQRPMGAEPPVMDTTKQETVDTPSSQKQILPPRSAPGTFASEVARGAKGHASDGNYDINLTIDGLAFGDPVGMETFDLGFFEDGTPAIVINGANVPIKHDQWMALLTQRNKTRADIRQQMEFARNVEIGREAIVRVARSGVSLPPGAAETLLAQNELDPKAATDNLYKMYQAVSVGKGSDMVGSMQADIQSFRNRNLFGPLLERGPDRKMLVPNPANPQLSMEQVVRGQSVRDTEIERLRSGNTQEDAITLLAFERLEDFQLDPNYRKAFPNMRIGFFDRVHRLENADRYSDMSLFQRLAHLASNHQIKGLPTIPFQEPNPFSKRSVLSGAVDQRLQMGGALASYREYLVRLDQWASAAFGYDQSTAETLDQHAMDMMAIYSSNAQAYSDSLSEQTRQAQQVQSPQQNRMKRPSATGG